MPRLTQKIVDQWLEAYGRVCFKSGADGDDDIPDFSTLDPRGKSQSEKLSPSALADVPYNEAKCDARVWNSGFGKQCNCSKIEGFDLCKSHLKKFQALPDGLDIGLGRINKDRPTHSLDKLPDDPKYECHKWDDLKPISERNVSQTRKKRVLAKEMREKLTSMGVSIDGVKGKELTILYNQVIQDMDRVAPTLRLVAMLSS